MRAPQTTAHNTLTMDSQSTERFAVVGRVDIAALASLWTLRSADMTAERRPPLKRDDERPRVRLGGGRETWIMKCCAIVCNQNHAAAAA